MEQLLLEKIKIYENIISQLELSNPEIIRIFDKELKQIDKLNNQLKTDDTLNIEYMMAMKL